MPRLRPSGGDEGDYEFNTINMSGLYFPSHDTVKLCRSDNCIQVNGKNAELIARAAAFMLVLLGLAAFARAIK